MNTKNAPTLSSSEMQLKLALAMVILGFEERVDKQTQELLEIERAMLQLQRQREGLLEQRKRDADYLAASMSQLYPDVSLNLSEEGHVEIPSGVLQQLQQLQQAQQQSLPAPTALLSSEQMSDEPAPVSPADAAPGGTDGTFPSPAPAGETYEEAVIDPRAQKVLVYLFSQPQESVLDWRTTVQRALNLPEPPKIKGHAVYKALQHAYRLIESLHDGNLPHPADSFITFYTQYFIEGERWADYKDAMSEWGIA